MSSHSETETDILLSNRHLLAIFFVLLILLGIAFTGGYMAGRSSPEKKAAADTALSAGPADQTAKTRDHGSLETHSLAPATDQSDDSSAPDANEKPVPPPPAKHVAQSVPPPSASSSSSPPRETPLGAPKPKAIPAPPKPQPVKQAPVAAPLTGETFLQVAAVGHPEATALADVLSRKGFRAHAVAKPGATDVYRVLVGPLRDAAELAATRDSLRSAGFTKLFVQKFN